MSRRISILSIGNSHTAGFPQFDPHFGGNPQSSYQFWLLKRLKATFPDVLFNIDNEGVCGEFTTDIFRRLKRIENLDRYNIVLFWGGANDIGMGRKINRIVNNIETVQQFNSFSAHTNLNPILLQYHL